MRPSSNMASDDLRSHVRLVAAMLAAGTIAAGCLTDVVVAPKTAPPAPAAPSGLAAFGPARYLESSSRWIERTAAGTDLAILDQRRVELSGAKVVKSQAGDAAVEGGKVLPAWVKSPARYVFWKDRDVYLATSFLGELVKVATLPQDVSSGAVDWLDGVLLATREGALVLMPGTAADLKDAKLAPLAVPGAGWGLAADAKRAAVENVFGRVLLTSDGGKTWRDVAEEVGEVRGFLVRGNDLVIAGPSDGDHFVGVDGKLSSAATSPGPQRGARPPELDETWTEITSEDARWSLPRSAIPLGGGVALFMTGSVLGKLDLDSMKILASAELEDLTSLECTPVKLPDAVVLACAGEGRATVIDVTGVPRIERTFELPAEDVDYSGPSVDLDRFSAADGIGLGFLGPCEGQAAPLTDVDAISGASQRNASAERSPVFCARASADHWVEHRLDPEDAPDVIAWMPRPGGDATALVARAGRVVAEEQRRSVKGPLRVVRIARNQAPLALSPYAYRGRQDVSRDFRANADGSIEAWINNSTYGNSVSSLQIDADGNVRLRPIPPRTDSVQSAGPFAMAHADDGRLFETVDWGRRWIEVKPPVGDPSNTRPGSCSAVGCDVGGYVRVGWDSVDSKLPSATTDYESARSAARSLREKLEYRRPPPKTTLSRLSCQYASPSEGARLPDAGGFGFTTTFMPRSGGNGRMGMVGSFTVPWWNGPMPSGLDIDLAWVEPFDLDARIRRATIPLSHAGFTLQNRPYEMRFAYVLDEEGRVELLPTGSKDQCLSSILEEAGIVAKTGACVNEQSLGVRIKDRMLVGSTYLNGFRLTAIDLPRAADGEAAVGSSQREIRTGAGGAWSSSYSVGLGVRAGAPVAVAVDGRGAASLAPLDANDGYLGPAEALAPLTELRVGTDAKCSTSEKLADGEARVLLTFDTEIGLARGTLPGVTASGTMGVAVIRWSKDAACLEGVELTVRDERFDPDGSAYEGGGMLRKLIARFGKAPPKRGVPADKKPKVAMKAAPTSSASASASASAAASSNVKSPGRSRERP